MGLRKAVLLGAAVVSAGIIAGTAAQAQNEQFIPGLVYRTGAYAPTASRSPTAPPTTSPCSMPATAASTA